MKQTATFVAVFWSYSATNVKNKTLNMPYNLLQKGKNSEIFHFCWNWFSAFGRAKESLVGSKWAHWAVFSGYKFSSIFVAVFVDIGNGLYGALLHFWVHMRLCCRIWPETATNVAVCLYSHHLTQCSHFEPISTFLASFPENFQTSQKNGHKKTPPSSLTG